MQKTSLTNPGVTGRKSAHSDLQPIALSVGDFAKSLGLSRTFVYKLIADGTVKTIKIGDRRLVPVTEGPRLIATAA